MNVDVDLDDVPAIGEFVSFIEYSGNSRNIYGEYYSRRKQTIFASKQLAYYEFLRDQKIPLTEEKHKHVNYLRFCTNHSFFFDKKIFGIVIGVKLIQNFLQTKNQNDDFFTPRQERGYFDLYPFKITVLWNKCPKDQFVFPDGERYHQQIDSYRTSNLIRLNLDYSKLNLIVN